MHLHVLRKVWEWLLLGRGHQLTMGSSSLTSSDWPQILRTPAFCGGQIVCWHCVKVAYLIALTLALWKRWVKIYLAISQSQKVVFPSSQPIQSEIQKPGNSSTLDWLSACLKQLRFIVALQEVSYCNVAKWNWRNLLSYMTLPSRSSTSCLSCPHGFAQRMAFCKVFGKVA